MLVYYGNGCTKCEILKSKLNDKGIVYSNGNIQDIIDYRRF